MANVILALGGVFALLFYFWAARSVTQPIEQLESSVTEFAASCKDQKDPEALHINVPPIHTNNEVESLARAVTKMSEAMQGYVKSIVYTETELESRYEIRIENYTKTIHIEALTLEDMVLKQFAPALMDYIDDLTASVMSKKELGIEKAVS